MLCGRKEVTRMNSGDIVRGPYGRRYQVLEANSKRDLYRVRRVKRDGQIDLRCGTYLFPGGYLTPIAEQKQELQS